jgi:hypothetical protein
MYLKRLSSLIYNTVCVNKPAGDPRGPSDFSSRFITAPITGAIWIDPEDVEMVLAYYHEGHTGVYIYIYIEKRKEEE